VPGPDPCREHPARDAGHDAIDAALRDELIRRFRHGVLLGLSKVDPTILTGYGGYSDIIQSRSSAGPGDRDPSAKAKQPPGRTLLEVLRDRSDDVLRFTHDLRVPPTNNQARTRRTPGQAPAEDLRTAHLRSRHPSPLPSPRLPQHGHETRSKPTRRLPFAATRRHAHWHSRCEHCPAPATWPRFVAAGDHLPLRTGRSPLGRRRAYYGGRSAGTVRDVDATTATREDGCSVPLIWDPRAQLWRHLDDGSPCLRRRANRIEPRGRPHTGLRAAARNGGPARAPARV
jgi:hypothetical protein